MTAEQLFRVHVHSEGGSLWAEVADLPGCFVSGDSMGEIKDALEEAIGFCLSTADHVVHVRILSLDPIHDGFESARVLVDA